MVLGKHSAWGLFYLSLWGNTGGTKCSVGIAEK
jgi:hypothetical protein